MFAPSWKYKENTIHVQIWPVMITIKSHKSKPWNESHFTLSLVPLAPVESARSLPAKSTRLILLTCMITGEESLNKTEREKNGATCEALHCSWSTFQTAKLKDFIDLFGNAEKRAELGVRTFSDVLSVSMSCFFCVKMMLKTAWERLLVSFMLVAATVLKTKGSVNTMSTKRTVAHA